MYPDESAYDAEPPTPLLFAALAGGVAIVAVAAVAFLKFAFPPLQLLAGLVTLAAIVWLLLFLLLFRRANVGWSVAAFVAVAITAMTAGAWQFVHEAQVVKEDGRVTQAILAAYTRANGMPAPGDLPSANGPMSTVTRNLLERLTADQATYQAALDQSGFKSIFSPADLARDDSVVRDCGRVQRLKDALATYRRDYDAHVSAARVEAANSKLPDRFKRNFLDGFDRSRKQGSDDLDEIATIEGSLLEEGRQLCLILARRGWQIEGDRFLFTNDRDLTDYNAGISRFQAHARRQEQLQQARLEQSRGQMREMEKALN